MDTASSLVTSIHHQTLPTPAFSPSKSTITLPPDITGDLPPQRLINSVNQLRCFSTALSDFLSRYDELLNHISFINSSIDSKLSGHLAHTTTTDNPNLSPITNSLETLSNQTIAALPKVVVFKEIAKERVSDYQRIHAISTANENATCWLSSDGIDTSKKAEVVDASEISEEVVACMMDVEIDASKTEDIDISMKLEEIDTSKKPEEVDVPNNPEKIDASKKCDDIDVLMKLVEIDVLRNRKEIDALKTHAETDIWKKHEEISEEVDVCMEDVEIDTSKTEDIDISMKLEEIDTSKKPEEVDVSNNPEQIDASKKCDDIDVSMKLVEFDVLRNRKEIDALETHAETDTLKKPEETVVEISCAQTITPVLVAVVSEKNPSEMASDCEQNHENMRTPESLEEINVLKKPEQIDIPDKPGETDFVAKPEQTVIVNKPKEIDILKKAEQTDICKNPEDIDTSMNSVVIYTPKSLEETETARKHEETGISKNDEETDVSRQPKETENSKKSIVSRLEFFCQNMRNRMVRKHVTKHLYEMNKLHNEIAKALKMAEDPVKLVLDSFGRFFLMSSRSFVKNSPETLARMVSLLILECFVMMSGDGIEISKTQKEYAEQAATDWRNRMIKEGGLGQTDEIDARGLLLFISGFGIQDDVFKIQDIVDLIRASNVKEISSALRCSVFLIPKVPEVIDFMVKNNLEIEAADIAFTFGLEHVCHPQNILRTYLANLVKDIQNDSSSQTLEAMKQHLCQLKSVKQCLESHNVDPSILPPDFKMNETIHNLERETNEGKLTQKWKSLENPIHSDVNRECTQKSVGHAETDTSKEPEVTVAETSCAQTINAVPEAIVLNQNPSRMALNCEQTPEAVEVVDISKKPEERNICKNPEESESENSKKSIISELELMCKNMSFKKLKSHVTTHFSQLKNCHKEIVKALKLAVDPAKLVLRSIGKFFAQSIIAFCKNSHLSVVRMALVLILECFVTIGSDGIVIAKTEKEHAAEIAAEWRNQMIKGGRLGQTGEVDARGLLLFISGFGIQDNVFKIQDIADLMRASNLKGISTALRGSAVLIAKLPDVIDLMVKNNLQIEAVDIAYTFGMKDKCYLQNTLRTYLHNLVKDIQIDSSLQTLKRRKKQLQKLKSVKQCLEYHKVDPSILLPDFNVDEMYRMIEVNVETMMSRERMPSESPTHQEAKRACFNHENMPHQHKPVVGHHGTSPCNRSTQPSTHYVNNSENIVGSVPDVPAYGLPGAYDQLVHRADVPPYGWHDPNGQAYGSQPYGRPCEWVPSQPVSYAPPPGRWGPRASFPGYVEVPPSGGFPGRWGPPEPYHGVKIYPPSSGFPRRQGPSPDLYNFADKI